MTTDVDTPAPEFKPLRQFLTRIPGHRPGTRTHLSTGIRFVTKGVRDPAGRRVKLRAVRFGAKWLTTELWWAEFFSAVTGVDAAGEVGERPQGTPAALAHAGNAASAALDHLLGAAGD